MSLPNVESDTERLISRKLENLGWEDSSCKTNRNVFMQSAKTPAQRRALDGKRPDYILYQSNSDKPLGIIEAKKQGANIHKALEQGLDYAKRLDAPLVFASDGVFTKTLHQKIGYPLLLNGEEVDDLMREKLALRYLETNEVNTLHKTVLRSRWELISIFGKVNDLLREEGLQPGLPRFSEFANLLFLKVLSELETIKEENGQPASVDKDYRWEAFHKQEGQALLSYINDTVLKQFNTQYKDEQLFRPLSIKPPALKEIIELLDDLQLSDINADVKGDAFEYFISAYSDNNPSDLGEIFTPRHIVKTMVKLLNPKSGESIYDPFCGTGGMLITAFKHVMDGMAQTEHNLSHLRRDALYGNELTKTASIAKMNMILAGDGHNNIIQQDSYQNPVDGKHDVVITNYPFAQKTRYGSTYPIPNRKGDIISPQHCLRALNPRGRMAFIAPEGLLSNTQNAYKQVRQYLLENAKLERVISLPPGAFQPHNAVKTNILYFTDCNTGKTSSHFWYFNVRNHGYTLGAKPRKIEGPNDMELVLSEKDLESKEEAYLKNTIIQRVDLEHVKRNDYVLRPQIETSYQHAQSGWQRVNLGDLRSNQLLICKKGNTITKAKTKKGMIPVIAGGKTSPYFHNEANYQGNVVTISASGAYSGFVAYHNYPIWASDCTVWFSSDENNLITKYLYYAFVSVQQQIYSKQHGTGIPHVYRDDLNDIQIPLPPLDEQQAIVEKLNAYQKVIDGARQVVKWYAPKFEVKEGWQWVTLGEICEFEYGYTANSSPSGDVRYIRITDINDDGSLGDKQVFVSLIVKNRKFLLKKGDILVARVGSVGESLCFNEDTPSIFASYLIRLHFDKSILLPFYLKYCLRSDFYWKQVAALTSGAVQPQFNAPALKKIRISLPSLAEQEAIVEKLEAERQHIEANKELIKLMEKKCRIS